MILKFFGGPYDGNYVDEEKADRFAPFSVGDCLLFPGGHAYGCVGDDSDKVWFKFIRTLSKSERMTMKVCEFKVK